MSDSIVLQEHRKLVRAWIWFWYNDVTRLLGVMFGLHLVVVLPVLMALGLQGENLRHGVVGAYVFVLAWAFLDNDYSQLRRIGLDEYRKPLNPGPSSSS